MTEFDAVKLHVEAIRYTDDISYVRDLLVAFHIPPTTVSRVVDTLKCGKGLKTAKLYRRAAITIADPSLSESQEYELFQAHQGTPLHVIISSGMVTVFENECNSVVRFHADESSGNLISLLKLAGIGKSVLPTDPRGVAELSAELHNLLTAHELANAENISAMFILNLNYLSFVLSRFGDMNLREVFIIANTFKEKDFNKVLCGLLKALTASGHSQFALTSFTGFSFMSDSFSNIPRLSYAATDLAIKILDYNLKNVDAEALSSLLYKVINPSEKGLYGYKTSLGNANKVLGPVFFSELRKKVEDADRDERKLKEVLDDLEKVVFFDPTDGPGSFLSLAISKTFELADLIREMSDGRLCAKIIPEQFIGTASNSLTARTAHLCLFSTFIQAKAGYSGVTISEAEELYNRIKVVECDQLCTPWRLICPNHGHTIIVGCPVFRGFKKLSSEDKERMARVFGQSKCGDADFSSAWLVLGARYISGTTSRLALVLTNSICQGVQVGQVWPLVFSEKVGISFAHTSFRWRNGQDQSSAVTVVIVGLASDSMCIENLLFCGEKPEKVKVIGPYLTGGNRLIVKKRRKRFSDFMPPMVKGNMPYENEHLLLTDEEKGLICSRYPSSCVLFRKALGSLEFIRRVTRWCLWIPDHMLTLAKSIPPIAARIALVKAWRESNDDIAVKKLAHRAHQFREFNETTKSSIIIPSVSSERRPYIPIGFVGPDTIITNLAFAIYDCEPWVMGVLSSKMHMAWVRTVCGSLETRLRYSNELGYNTFPFPVIDDPKKQALTRFVFDILSEREKYPETNLGALYTEMPAELKALHYNLDAFVDSCYSDDTFGSDVDRVTFLFTLFKE